MGRFRQTSFAPPLVVIAAKKGTSSEGYIQEDKVFSVSNHTIFIGEVVNSGLNRTGSLLTLEETGLFYNFQRSGAHLCGWAPLSMNDSIDQDSRLNRAVDK